MSLARERQLGLPAHPLTDVEGLGLGPNQKEVLLRYLEEARPLRIKREASVFEANMPGILSPEEVRRDINLGKWRLKLNDIVVYLEVANPNSNTVASAKFIRISFSGSAAISLIPARSKVL